MWQQITLVGNLGSDPELKTTPSGIPVTSFNLAINKSWVDGNGQRHEKALWFRVTCWRKLAETASQYLTKGRQVLVIGEMEEARPWTDRDGNQRASLEVTAQAIKFLNGGGKGEQSGPAASSEPADGNDIPF